MPLARWHRRICSWGEERKAELGRQTIMHDTTTALMLVAAFPLALGAFLWLLCWWERWLLSPSKPEDARREPPGDADQAQPERLGALGTAAEAASPGGSARVPLGSGRVVP